MTKNLKAAIVGLTIVIGHWAWVGYEFAAWHPQSTIGRFRDQYPFATYLGFLASLLLILLALHGLITMLARFSDSRRGCKCPDDLNQR